MVALEIFKSQFIHLIQNFKEFFKILFPLALFAVLLASDFLVNILVHSDKFVILVILRIVYILFIVRVIVNIHRLVILNEAFDYYALNKRLKETLLYICYGILGFVVTFLVFLPFGAVILASYGKAYTFSYPIQFKILFGIFITLSYIFFILNFPMISTGKKIKFFKMIKLSKGFRLTLLLQVIVFSIITLVMNFISGFVFGFTLVLSMHFVTIMLNLILAFLNLLIMAWSVSCISKTYMLWKKAR
jgi:hypothetical protein